MSQLRSLNEKAARIAVNESMPDHVRSLAFLTIDLICKTHELAKKLDCRPDHGEMDRKIDELKRTRKSRLSKILDRLGITKYFPV